MKNKKNIEKIKKWQRRNEKNKKLKGGLKEGHRTDSGIKKM